MYDLISSNLFWFLIFPCIVFAVFCAVIYFVDRDKHLTISQCIGKTKSRALAFALVSIFVSVPIYLTLIFYIGPSRNLPAWYYAAVFGTWIGLVILLLFPHKKDSFRMHYFGANLWAIMLVVLCFAVLLSGQTTLIERIFLVQFIASGVAISVILFFNKFGRFTFWAETFGLVNWAIILFVLAF